MSKYEAQLAKQATSSNFNKYRRLMRHILVAEYKVTKAKARTLCDLLDALESIRVSFTKGKRCFETKRASSKEIGLIKGVSERYIRELMCILEKAGIVRVLRKRYDRTHNFKNRYVLNGFRVWLSTFTQVSFDSVPSSHDNDLRSLLTTSKNGMTFPESRHIGKFWKVEANEVQNLGEDMPCLANLSDKFRANIDRHQIPRNRWTCITLVPLCYLPYAAYFLVFLVFILTSNWFGDR